MPNRKNLPFLLSLLDDNSPIVQEEVSNALAAFGVNLRQEVSPYLADLSDVQSEELEKIFDSIRESQFDSGWLGWLDNGDFPSGLEHALTYLASLECGEDAYQIKVKLDMIADRFLSGTDAPDATKLMAFLFQEESFRSPTQEGYSQNYDNLFCILDSYEGSQVALSCLAILVGARCGIELHGISIQGNFMAIAYEGKQMKMYNSYNNGKPLARASVLYIEEAFRRSQVSPTGMKAEIHEIVMHVLKNSIDAYHHLGFHQEAYERVDLYRSLIHELRARGWEKKS